MVTLEDKIQLEESRIKHAAIVQAKQQEDKTLLNALPEIIRKNLDKGVKLPPEETYRLMQKTGWNMWKVLAVWMRVTGRS